MFDFFGFLLQTLTASGVAAVLLIIKALFKDKLPPRWQFAAWGVLGIAMLVPAGNGGRYVLFHWRFVVELIKSWFGDYRFIRIVCPFPVMTSIPHTLVEWFFAGYVLGVAVHVWMYVASYLKLRRVVRMGNVPSEEKWERIQAMAAGHRVILRSAVEVRDLPSAFVFGVFHPVLVLPAGAPLDEKILLHELFHLKHKDTLWSILICLLRSLHWCNPLLVYCANRALNDMESRCDQYVLETLASEERREYGYVLLAMANETFAKTPGSTCINNGGRNIRERVENIVRFKRYPKGMWLVSLCMLFLLSFSFVTGAQATTIFENSGSVRVTLASARSVICTTPAGAFDAYGKAVLDENGYFRAMCAPESMQEEIGSEMRAKDLSGEAPLWDSGLSVRANAQTGFYLYNFKQQADGACEGLFVVELNYPPDGKEAERNKMYLAVQNLRVEREGGRWVAIPLEAFRYIDVTSQSLRWGCTELPGRNYADETADMRVEVVCQTIYLIDSRMTNQHYYDLTPKPDAMFTDVVRSQTVRCMYSGSEETKDAIKRVGLSLEPVYAGEERPTKLPWPIGQNGVTSDNTGRQYGSQNLEPGWDSPIWMGGGGETKDPEKEIAQPEYYVADLYLNDVKVANLELILQEGEAE